MSVARPLASAAMSSTDVPIAKALVAAASISFISTVFTRDAFFSLATFTAFWVFIFGEIFYGAASAAPVDSVVWVNTVLGAVAMAAVVGVILVKLLGTGRLVDVWLTRAPPSLNNKTSDDWHIPLFIVATATAFAASYFFTYLALGGGVPVWPGGMTPSTTWTWVFAIVATFVTLLLLALAFVQRRITTKNISLGSGTLVYYFFAWVIAAGAPVVAWIYIDASSATVGFAAGAIAFVINVILLALGYIYERYQVGYSEAVEENASFASPYDGLYTGGSGLIAGVRIFFISLTHGLIFVIGGLGDVVDSAPADEAARDIFWFPYLALYFTIAFLVYFVVYSLIVVYSYWNYSKVGREETRYLTRAPLRQQTGARAEFAVRQPSPSAENKPRRRSGASHGGKLRFV